MIGGRPMFLFGLFASACATVGFTFFDDIPGFTAMWSINRFVQSMGWGALVKITSKWVGPKVLDPSSLLLFFFSFPFELLSFFPFTFFHSCLLPFFHSSHPPFPLIFCPLSTALSQEYGRIMAIHSLSYMMGDAIIRLIFGQLLNAGFTWEQLFYLSAVVAVVMLIPAFFTLKGSPVDVGEKEPTSGEKNVYSKGFTLFPFPFPALSLGFLPLFLDLLLTL
jgi:MFS family permease